VRKDLEQRLIKKYPFLSPYQDASVVENNLEIMTKSMDEEKAEFIKSLSPQLKEEFEKRKNRKNPEIYGKTIEPIYDLMVFGLMVGDGWYDLLDKLCFKIQNHLIKINKMTHREYCDKFITPKLEELKRDMEKYGDEIKIKVAGGTTTYFLRTKYDNLLRDRDELLRDPEKKLEIDLKVDEVKEKFGGLRFYYTGGDFYIEELVSKAEEASYTICEVCGSKGKLCSNSYRVIYKNGEFFKIPSNGGWLKTLCRNHAKESHYQWSKEKLTKGEAYKYLVDRKYTLENIINAGSTLSLDEEKEELKEINKLLQVILSS
jgi:hypothetical protein